MHPTIDCGGQRFTLAIAEQAILAIRAHGGVTLINCSGADLSELALEMLLMAQRMSAQEVPSATP